jgi:hypothetical protein
MPLGAGVGGRNGHTAPLRFPPLTCEKTSASDYDCM